MIQLISAEAINKSGFSFDNVTSYASATGLLAAGFVVAHAGLKLIKQDQSWIAAAGLSVAGLAGAMFISNPYAKLGLIGIAVYGGLKALVNGAREVTAPANTGAGGLSGLIPETIKAKIRNFIPSLGSLGDYDEVQGYGDVVDDQGYGSYDDPANNNGNYNPVEGPAEELMGVAQML